MHWYIQVKSLTKAMFVKKNLVSQVTYEHIHGYIQVKNIRNAMFVINHLISQVPYTDTEKCIQMQYIVQCDICLKLFNWTLKWNVQVTSFTSVMIVKRHLVITDIQMYAFALMLAVKKPRDVCDKAFNNSLFSILKWWLLILKSRYNDYLHTLNNTYWWKALQMLCLRSIIESVK